MLSREEEGIFLNTITVVQIFIPSCGLYLALITFVRFF